MTFYRETNHFVWIAMIGQMEGIFPGPRFMTNLEIVIEEKNYSLGIFKIKYQQSTIIMKILCAKWKIKNKIKLSDITIQREIQEWGVETLVLRSSSGLFAITDNCWCYFMDILKVEYTIYTNLGNIKYNPCKVNKIILCNMRSFCLQFQRGKKTFEW